MAKEMDVVLCEVAEEAEVNQELAHTECRLIDELAHVDHELKIIREKRKLNELKKNSKRMCLNILRLHSTICQCKMMIQREKKAASRCKYSVINFLNYNNCFVLWILVPQMFTLM